MSIPVATTIEQTRVDIHALSAGRVGFVPTMGALHRGHGRLIEVASDQCDFVVVSIFVNPLQFDRRDDYDRYARSLPDDIALAERYGAHLAFAPSVEEMYPRENQTFVEVTGLTDHFCGASRPGHFKGVTTVVAKLFHIVQPDLAFFGEKDAQQLAVIERMTADQNFPVTIVPVPTVREHDGLALSSRNARLSEEERRAAPALYRALCAIEAGIAEGERDARALIEIGRAQLHPLMRVDYLDIADPGTLGPVRTATGPVRAMGAVWLGGTRLIDNLLCVSHD